MKPRYIVLIFIVLSVLSCDEKWLEKPESLIPEKQMSEILLDLHMAKALENSTEYSVIDDFPLTDEDLYYSVLHKHQVADSVFEKSFIYYSSYPKQLEEIYADMLDKANQMNTDLLESINQPLDVSNTE